MVVGKLDLAQWIIFGLSELIALVLIVRLWNRRGVGVVGRVVWSLVLLVPVVGPAAFLWVRPNVPEHSYDCDDATAQVDPGGHDGGGH